VDEQYLLVLFIDCDNMTQKYSNLVSVCW